MIPVALQQNNQRDYGYPFCLLPEKLVDVIRFVELETQAPSEMIAASLLGVMSLACQDVFDVSPKDKLRYPVSLYQVILAESGERKSSVDKLLMSPIRELEKTNNKIYLEEVSEFEIANSIWRIEYNCLEKALKAAVVKNGVDKDVCEKNLRDCLKRKPEPPVCKVLLINDATPAAVKQALGLGWPSVGLVSDEAGGILGGDLIKDTPLLNSLWSGQPIKVDRANSESFCIDDARLGSMLMVQPGLFIDYVKRHGVKARTSGFFARTLICQPRSTIGTRFSLRSQGFASNPNPTADVLEHFKQRIHDLFEQAFNRRRDSQERICLTLSPEAQESWNQYYNQVELQCGNGGALFDFKDYASKQLEHASRIAGVIEGFTTGGPMISGVTMKSAIAISQWYLDSFIGLMGAVPEEVLDANLLYSWLAENLWRTVNGFYIKNYILQFGPGALRNKERLNRAIGILHMQNRVALYKQHRTNYVQFLYSVN